MKKVLCLVFCILFAVLALPFFAFSADYTADSEGRYTVEISGLQAETEYVIVIVAGDYTGKDIPDITEENLIYMNQAESDSEGCIIFEDFIPMTDSVGTVFVSGWENLTNSGVLLNDDGFGFIAGRIISYTSRDSESEVTVPEKYTEIASNAFDTAKNIKNIFIPYTIRKIAENAFTAGTNLFLSPNITSSIKEYVAENIGVYVMGDYNGDKTVDKSDLDEILLHFAKEENSENDLPSAFINYFDLNFDGEVTLLDASVLLSYLWGAIVDFFI